MTAGFLRVPIMRPKRCWIALHVSIIAGLLVTLNADSDDSTCYINVIVPRDTVYEALVEKGLRINCTVEFCNNSPPDVSWYKIEETLVPINFSSNSHIRVDWTRLNNLVGFSSLIFEKVHRNDSGVYQCTSGGMVSHNINVLVIDDSEPTDITPQTETTDNTSLEPEFKDNLWMYGYTAAGILAFVIIVIIISVASMQGCKGKSKTETQTDNQYMAIPMVQQPHPHAGLQASSRGSPSAPPSRRSTRKKTPPSQLPSQPNELPLPSDDEHLYGQIKEDGERRSGRLEEELGSVVYAALNHQLPAGAAARPRQPKEECSEYAVIRVKDH